MNIIVEELHARGHSVSVVRTEDSWYIKESSPFYTAITLKMDGGFDHEFITIFVGRLLEIQRKGRSFWACLELEMEEMKAMSILHKKWAELIEHIFDDKHFMESSRAAKFDVVLTDPFTLTGFLQRCFQTAYLAENTYIDTSVQKGGISGMPGCLEHTGVVTQLIREARENMDNLSVLWFDLENAFGSITHKLVQFTLTKHHVPSRCRDLIADYYSNFRMRVSSGAITSSWHKVEIGIITISVTLFYLAMNMLTKSAEPECRGPRTNSGQRQPPIRAFMDDLTVVTESVPGCRWILKGLEELVEWARMHFKPAKFRSMVLRKGKVVDKFRFNIANTAIPSISEKPVKSLGKVFDCSLRDTTSIQSTCTELDGWLKSVDKSYLGSLKPGSTNMAFFPGFCGPSLSMRSLSQQLRPERGGSATTSGDGLGYQGA
ncbi:hypothetical protein NHX12_005454 [Muraenolepis orangiensis]|uniref:Reverse transcriptase domain-containing protein n=1 Tax=Muraenolepis orangiensis TaxID=630683 RepID=A0A9Q0DV18_9TELE|nr:hypothetical protein NHX12_005454 [Muraenolepis orangiensis]